MALTLTIVREHYHVYIRRKLEENKR